MSVVGIAGAGHDAVAASVGGWECLSHCLTASLPHCPRWVTDRVLLLILGRAHETLRHRGTLAGSFIPGWRAMLTPWICVFSPWECGAQEKLCHAPSSGFDRNFWSRPLVYSVSYVWGITKNDGMGKVSIA